MRSCHYCKDSSKEMRPYGPNGSSVCFPCAMATPERKTQAMRQLGKRFEAAGEVAVLGPDGPEAIKGEA